MDKCVFSERFKHGRLDFHPGVVYGFEDPDAVPYFKAAGVAKASTKDADVEITIGELDIDPLTIWGTGDDRGKFVMPERAADHLGVSVKKANAFVAVSPVLTDFEAQVQAELKGTK